MLRSYGEGVENRIGTDGEILSGSGVSGCLEDTPTKTQLGTTCTFREVWMDGDTKEGI